MRNNPKVKWNDHSHPQTGTARFFLDASEIGLQAGELPAVFQGVVMPRYREYTEGSVTKKCGTGYTLSEDWQGCGRMKG